MHSSGSGNGDNGLLNVMRNDTQFSGGGSSRLSSQDIIRHPPHSRPSVRLESANGNKKMLAQYPKTCFKSRNLSLGLRSSRMLIALYDYNAREISDMSFWKGDRMELLDDR